MSVNKTTDITDIAQYLNWAKHCHDVEYGPNDEFTCYQRNIYFRGQASTSWNLIPSIFRKQGDIYEEHRIFQRACNMLWNELIDCKSALEKLIRLQHYGLHTRLLDVTYNPLVALYFACQSVTDSNCDKDGIVYSGHLDVNEIKVSMAIAEYIVNHDTTDIHDNIIELLCKQFSCKRESLNEIQLIEPPYNSKRINAQKGAFIVSPLLNDKDAAPFNYAKYSDISEQMKSAFCKECIIRQQYKTTILEELDSIGINKATVFMDISSILDYINEKKDNEWKLADCNYDSILT